MKRSLTVLTASLTLMILGGASSAWLASHALDEAAGSLAVTRITSDNLRDVEVLTPGDDPAGLVVLLSDRGGLTSADRELASQLVDEGLIVLPVDLDRWMAALDTDAGPDGECIYLGSDLEGIAKEALRALELDTYFHPVVVGRGEGGTLAYAAVADAPAATLAGGIGLNAPPAARSRIPVCEGATATPEGPGAFAYDRGAELPAPFTFVAQSGTEIATAMSAPMRAGQTTVAGAEAQETATVQGARAIADADRTELPIVVGKPKGQPRGLVVFFSGDGGWRDLDKTIGDWLTAEGIEVIGVDSLRYFWSEKSAKQMADDISSMLADAKPAANLPIGLLGYSFGADTLPFAFADMPGEWTKRVSLVGLLAPSHQTGFQISVGGWLGMSTGDSDVVAAAAGLPADRVLCVYGKDEDDTACLDPKLAAVTKLPLEGGHHFDGNYDSLAARLLAALMSGPQAGLAEPPPPAGPPAPPAR
ncbi:AcvB/VirJ family lysyl-phosphatidylglycerol hydrolase [Aureimonas sp. SK2]|uniref:AcvB/VirJ family lysyl-phosphatidylglycerol hydrolase n=1 Tax=Aureimonas sp. SK2 TaxID=3015992 RepID=UPI002444AE39|nr:AcvB/VirJ family lysyl-phosphatidylglycerol hydrolase [Aureimonas sp. SK2]